MIDAVDQRLQDWIGNLAHPAEAYLLAPGQMGDKQGVSLHLLELISTPPPRGTHRPPLAVTVRYLVTTWFNDAAKAHRLLGDLTFAAMEDKEFEVEPEAVPLEMWRAFNVPPRPALLMRVKVNKPRDEKPAPRVRGRVAVEFGDMLPFQGQLFGPGGVPISAASVTLPSLRLTTRTDYNGRFRFAAVPKRPRVTQLRVNARGKDVTIPVPEQKDGAPLLIELEENQI